MVNHASVKRLNLEIKLGLFFLIIYIPVIVLLIMLVVDARQKLVDLGEQRHQSYVLADHLRQTSDDLTRMVRSYVATGNERFKEQFLEVMNIRKGEAPRPKSYERIYWDFLAVEDGSAPFGNTDPIPLVELFEKAGFTEEEIELLKLSQKRSDKLIELEMEAISLVENVKDPSLLEQRRREALEILFSEDYHQAKAEIMGPINQFYEKLDRRTYDAILLQEARAHLLFMSLILLFLLGISLKVWLLYLRKRYNDMQKEELEKTIDQRTVELQELVKTKERILSIISHDLRGPLGSVRYLIQELDRNFDDTPEKEAKRTLKAVNDSITTTHELMENMLMWARLHMHYEKANEPSVLLSEVIPSSISAQLAMARSKDIEVLIEIDPQEHVVARQDSVALILRNLMSNAVKFTHRGGQIRIKSKREDGTVVISVEDNGVGIPSDHIEDIFKGERTYRSLGTEEEGSSGFGLNIAAEFAQSCSGKLSVESEEGKGTTFFLSVPG